MYFKTKRWYFAEQTPQNQGENAQTNVPTSTGSGGNKQQEEGIAEFLVGNNNEVEAENVKTVAFDGHNVDSANTLPNMRVRSIVGNSNKVRVKGNIETIGVRSNIKQEDSSVR